MKWTADTDPHVRRLVSEGTRSRLPWAGRLPQFIADPQPVVPLLEALHLDDELYVRRSVANHLGDIGKDHLDLVLEMCERWLAESQTLEAEAGKNLRWLIRRPAAPG